MGSGGPGNIVHIDNLYVTTRAVKTNTDIKLGDFVIFDTDGLRPLVIGDIAVDNTFFDLAVDGPVYQALEDANNLDALDVVDRKTEVSIATTGTDWTVKMAASVPPSARVGIHRLDARTPKIAVDDGAAAPTIAEALGSYKKKEFARLAEDSVLNDDGVVATGQAN